MNPAGLSGPARFREYSEQFSHDAVIVTKPTCGTQTVWPTEQKVIIIIIITPKKNKRKSKNYQCKHVLR